MKKILLTISLGLWTLYSASGQCIGSQYFNQNFSTSVTGGSVGTIPGGWTVYDVDNATPATNATLNTIWPTSGKTPWKTRVVAGDTVACSASWLNPVGTANDWLITPAMFVPVNACFSFEAMCANTTYPDGYEVRISTTNTAQSSFTTTLLSVTAEAGTFQVHTIDLSAYRGQTVYIAFINNTYDGLMLYIDDVKLVSTGINIGSSQNGFTVLSPNNNVVAANNATKTISFIHRNSTNYYGSHSGFYFHDYSLDGGQTWNVNYGPITPNSNNTSTTGRYPQAAIYNPTSNTTPTNAFSIFNGAYLNPSGGTTNAAWEGSVTGSVRLNGTVYQDYYSTVNSGSIDAIPRSLVKGSNNTFWTVFMNDSDGRIFVQKGTFVTNNVTWATNNIIVPTYDLSYDGTAQYSDWTVNIGFDPTGVNGWIAMCADVSAAGVTRYNPVFYRTTNSGASWTGPIEVNLNNFTALKTEIATGGGNLTCMFDGDLVVDVNGDPHYIIGVGEEGTTAYSIQTTTMAAIDISFRNSTSTWRAMKLKNLTSMRGIYGASTASPTSIDNRFQASRNAAGTRINYVWGESQNADNITPDAMGASYNVSTGLWTNVWDFTSDDPTFNDKAHLISTSYEAFTTASGTQVPTVVAGVETTTNDVLQTVTFHYLPYIEFLESWYTQTPTFYSYGATPVAAFSVSSTSICAGSSVSFTDLTTNSPTGWTWSITGPATLNSSVQNPTLTFNTAGTYSVSLTASNGSGSNTATQTNYITVTANVTPSITISTASNVTCPSASVTFNASISGGGSSPSYQWKRNGGNVGTNSATFTTTAIANGDVITCVLTSNATCKTTATATSNAITMTVSSSVTPSVTVSTANTNVCAGSSVTFTAAPVNGGTSPTYQWIQNSTNVGTNSSTYTTSSLPNGAQVLCVMTSNNACASPTSATSNTLVMTVNSVVTPSISINASSTSICSGSNVTFTASQTNGGSSPAYQWKVNGGNVGSNTNTYSSASLNNGDVVTCVLTSNAPCATSSSVASNQLTMTVNSSVTAAITISTASNSICTGASTTFTASPTNGGSSPVYQWKVNGNNVGANSPTFTTTTLNNNDVVTCVLTSNATCVTNSTSTSNSITMTVSSSASPAVSINASSTSVCTGTSVTFTASPANGGSAPAYQWKVNGSNVGSNSSTFTSSTLNNNDVVTCVMTSNSSCVTSTTATSNAITMTVNSPLTPSVSVSTGNTTICQGASVTFIANAVNGGTSPVYQWKLNGNNVGTNSPVYVTNTLANNDVVSCVITSNAACTTTSNASSNNVTMTVTTPLTAGVSITANNSSICQGGSVTLIATPTNGGSSPSYQWKVNGNNVGSNSPAYASSGFNNNDVVTCVMTSSETCVSSATTTSNSVTITVNPIVTASVTVTTGGGSTICSGETVVFTATASNGGSSPSYQWKLNGTNVGSNSTTYVNTSLTNGDVVTCVLTSNASCVSGSPATSNSVTITVSSSVTASVSVTASDDSICVGDNVIFTAAATGGGPSPSYQWKVNGANVGSNSATFTSSTLNNGDVVTCVMTTSSSCATGSPATSNSVTVTASSATTPVISQSGNTLTSSVTGTKYTWYFNGNPAGTTTTNQFTITQNGNYTVKVDNGMGCEVTSAVFAATVTALAKTVMPNVAKMYPNPTSGTVTLSIQLNQTAEVIVKVINMLGEEVYTTSYSANDVFENTLQLGHLPSGTYRMLVTTDEVLMAEKLIITK